MPAASSYQHTCADVANEQLQVCSNHSQIRHWRSPNSTESHSSRRHFSTNALHYRHLLRHIHGTGSSTWSIQAYLITDANIWQHDSHALFTQRFYGLKTGFNELKKITTPIVLIKQFVLPRNPITRLNKQSCYNKFLGAFAKLGNVTSSFVLSVPTGRNFMKFNISDFSKICRENFYEI